MIAPPRTVELLLASIGAESQFRDLVIGDLSEEFAQRAERDGGSAARRWYYREALRATPHLAYSAVRRIGVKGFWYRLGIVATAYTMTLMVGLVVAGTAFGVARAMGVPMNVKLATPSPMVMLGLLVVNAGEGILGGYIAAYLDRYAPLVSATLFGVTMVTVALAAGVIATTVLHLPEPVSPVRLWFRVLAMTNIVISAVVGGVLRVSTRGPAPAEELRAGND
jgi:hypothetical protein